MLNRERAEAAKLVGKMVRDADWRARGERFPGAPIIVALPDDTLAEIIARYNTLWSDRAQVTIASVDLQSRSITCLTTDQDRPDQPGDVELLAGHPNKASMTIGQLIAEFERAIAEDEEPSVNAHHPVTERYLVPA